MPRRDVFLFSVFALLSTSCDLWNAYRAADPLNCTLNTDLCTVNETCSATTERCEPLDPRSTGLRLDRVDPPTGPNSGEATLNLLGLGLYNLQQVTIDGQPATILSSDGLSTQVQLPASPGKTGYVPVYVRGQNSEVTRTDLFSYHNGSLSFGAGKGGSLRIALPSVAYSVDVGDVNGDRRPDVALGYQVGGDVGLVINEGGRRLSLGPSLSFENGPTIVALADLNKDGQMDLAAATAAVAGRVGVTLGRGSGQFDAFSSSTFVGHVLPSALAVGDVSRA